MIGNTEIIQATIALLATSVVVEIAPIKINPWGALARAIGKAMNHDLAEQLKEVEAKVELIGNEFEAHKERTYEKEASDNRRRILRFNDETLLNVNHSKEHFDNVLKDIDEYEEYCNAHPDYPNSRAVLAIAQIKEEYAKRLKENSFL